MNLKDMKFQEKIVINLFYNEKQQAFVWIAKRS